MLWKTPSLLLSPREVKAEACRSLADSQLLQSVAIGNKGPVLPDFLTFQEKQESQISLNSS